MSVELSEKGSVGVVRVDGPIDSAAMPAFDEALTGVVAGRSSVVVSLEKATFVCSAAWGRMLASLKDIQGRGGRFVLAGLPPAVQPVYEMLGLKSVLKTFPSEAEALRFVG